MCTIRWKSWLTLRGMGLESFLSDHGQDALVGVIGIGGPSPTAESAVEALETAGCAKVSALPGRMLFFWLVVGNGGAKVASQRGYGRGLGMAPSANNFEVAA